MELVEEVVALARRLGVAVEAPVSLRSTNYVVVWLKPSRVVAKISHGPESLGAELAVARLLADAGAPVVPPADGIGTEVHRVGEHCVTFWRHEPQANAPEPTAEAMASALFALHRALAEVGHRRTLPTYDERLIETIRSIDSPLFAPELVGSDRAVLRSTLSDVVARLARGPRVSEVIHGSPHRFNILVVQGAPRFIDFETVERGPIEWDLAHLDQEAAARYPGSVDLEMLALCRLATSAATSAWCWDATERGADMRFHAEHHLAVVRAATA